MRFPPDRDFGKRTWEYQEQAKGNRRSFSDVQEQSRHSEEFPHRTCSKGTPRGKDACGIVLEAGWGGSQVQQDAQTGIASDLLAQPSCS